MLGEHSDLKHELEIMRVLKKRKDEHIDTLKTDLVTVTNVACNPRLKNSVYKRLSEARDACKTLSPISKVVDAKSSAVSTADNRTRIPSRRLRYSALE